MTTTALRAGRPAPPEPWFREYRPESVSRELWLNNRVNHSPQDSAAFTVPGVEFTPVSPHLVGARLVTGALWMALPAVGAIIALIMLPTPWRFIPVSVVAIACLWMGWVLVRNARSYSYAELDDELAICRGIMFRRMVLVPYGRMQTIEITAGPVATRFGITTLSLNTAAGGTDAAIPGLEPAEAERLRERLAERGELKMAGL